MLTAEQKEQNIRENAKIQAFKDTFCTESGRIVLDELRRKFGLGACFLDKPVDPYRTHIDVGHLQVLGFIERQIERKLLDTE